MRARNIKPGFFTNDELADLAPITRLLFIGMWCMADRSGRMKDRPKKIRAEILPFDDCNIEQSISDLAKAGFIVRYSVEGKNYIQINKFDKHQHPHVKESASEIPPVPDEHHTSTVLAPDKPGINPPDCGLLIVDCGLLIPDSNTTTTATRTEQIFIDCFSQNALRLKELYPYANYEAERETCIAHYRSGAPPIDCYPVILKWFQRVPKPKTAAKVLPITFEQQKMDNTKRAMMEFIGGDDNDGFRQKTICANDGRDVGGVSVRLQ